MGEDEKRYSSPAFRLLSVLSNVKKIKAPDAFAGWAQVFDLMEYQPAIRERLTVSALMRLQAQVDLVERQISDLPTRIEERSYRRALKAIRATLAFQRFKENWEKVVGHLSDETLGVLRVLAQFLPSDDVEIPESELQELEAEALGFRDEISSRDDISDRLRVFVIRQLEILLASLRNYRFEGPKAFQEGSLEAEVKWASHRDEIEGEEDAEELARLKVLWGRIVGGVRRFSFLGLFLLGVLEGGDAALGIVEKRHLLSPPLVEVLEEQSGDAGKIDDGIERIDATPDSASPPTRVAGEKTEEDSEHS